MKYLNCLLVAGCLALVAAPAQAALTTYDVGSGTVSALGTDPGLVIQTSVNPNLDSIIFGLDDGDSYTFDFFDIWTNETAVNPDDTLSSPITADLSFDLPGGTASVEGDTVGFYALYVLQAGGLAWDGPETVTVGSTLYEVELSDETFNWGFLSLTPGYKYGATVEATVTQLSSPSPGPAVPAPGSVLLGVFGLGLVGWRRHHKA